jgi:uncharacterized integral membrane protein
MAELRSFFSHHEDLTQVILYAGIITGLWFAEMMASVESISNKWKHSIVNTLFIFTALPIQLLLTTFVVLISAWVMGIYLRSRHWCFNFTTNLPVVFKYCCPYRIQVARKS